MATMPHSPFPELPKTFWGWVNRCWNFARIGIGEFHYQHLRRRVKKQREILYHLDSQIQSVKTYACHRND